MPGNARLFVAFRVLFNARFYYPVLAVLFVDLGLTLDQYALLNVAWAVSIVLFELPLGALGDQIGRKPLVVSAAALMVVEMAVLAFAPTGNPALLFAVFLVNRVLSGLAEAAASGADEALAYDTLVEEGCEKEWPKVLARLQRTMSIAFVLTMVIGGAVYDPDLMGGILGVELDQQTTARFPVYLTLLLSLGAFGTAVAMREPGAGKPREKVTVRSSLAGIAAAGRWIVGTRFALALILFSLVLDSPVRVFLTLTSSYYRLIDIPAAYYGVLGAAFGLFGIFVPTWAQHRIRSGTAFANYALVTVLVLLGLAGCASVTHWAGAFFIVFLALGWHLLSFFGSHYLNAATESSRRATVLSFKSLANNLAYGAAGWAFAILMRALAHGEPPPPGSDLEDAIFARALTALPIALLAVAAPLFLWSARIRRMKQTAPEVPDRPGDSGASVPSSATDPKRGEA